MGDIEASARPAALGACFRGFTAIFGDTAVELSAFVQEPGDYQGDPIHILYMAAQVEGRQYRAGVGAEPYGTIELHVTSVTPRFVGHVTGVLYGVDDSTASPLTLRLRFDIDAPDVCG